MHPFVRVSSIAIAVAGVAATAQAQELPPRPESAPETEQAPEDTIVVTAARRRDEDVQDVPVAVSIVDERQLDAIGSINVAKLTQLQPSLQFYSTNPRNSAANIRGLGAPFGLTNDGIEQGVGVYIDQVYNGRIAAATRMCRTCQSRCRLSTRVSSTRPAVSTSPS